MALKKRYKASELHRPAQQKKRRGDKIYRLKKRRCRDLHTATGTEKIGIWPEKLSVEKIVKKKRSNDLQWVFNLW